MKIGTKVNLILIIVLLSGISISGIALSNLLQTQVENAVSDKALLLMEVANSVRAYTNDSIQPLLLPKIDTQEQFIPEAIPTFSAKEVFKRFTKNKEYENYSYRDAALNPTNLRDKTDEFEANIVEEFRQDSNLKIKRGYRKMGGQNLFYSARPFRIPKQSCLRCHTTSLQAPKSQINSYGKDNGFGWKLNQVVATQIVYVPAEELDKTAHQGLVLILGVIATIFTALVIIMNQLLKTTVLQRIKRIATVAEQVSVGDMNADFGKQSKDEIGNLAEAFNRMKYSLEIALNILNNKNK